MNTIIVTFPRMENGKSIKRILVNNGFEVHAVCTTGAQTLQYADVLEQGIVVCAGRMQDMMYTQLREYLPSYFQMLVLAAPALWEQGVEEHVVALSMPLKVHELLSTLEMMEHTAVRRPKKRRAAERSEEEKQMIRRAKEVLAARNSMTEEEAHRYLQKCSMDSGTSLSETAQMILSML
ncbi:MAG: ANTAR domain-containing protein [Lachnospiraceae bacterium]|nr:ANTAR domain-containing protein [Lachnospiraceae bacterium]